MGIGCGTGHGRHEACRSLSAHGALIRHIHISRRVKADGGEVGEKWIRYGQLGGGNRGIDWSAIHQKPCGIHYSSVEVAAIGLRTIHRQGIGGCRKAIDTNMTRRVNTSRS